MSSDPPPPATPNVPWPGHVAGASPPPAPDVGTPPPPAPVFVPADQARVVFSQLDPTGMRPTAIVAGVMFGRGGGVVSGAGPSGPAGGAGPPGPGPPGPTAETGTIALSRSEPKKGSTLIIGPLSIPLENGWVPQDVPGSGIALRLVKGSTVIDLIGATLQGQAAAADIYNSYVRDLQGASSGRSATQPNAVQIGAGIPAVRGAYTGVFGQNQVEGQLTAFLTGDGQGWIFDAWGPTGTLGSMLPEAEPH